MMDAVVDYRKRRALFRAQDSDTDIAMTSPDMSSERTFNGETFPIIVRINSLPPVDPEHAG